MGEQPISENIVEAINEQVFAVSEKAQKLKFEADRALQEQNAWEKFSHFYNQVWVLHILQLVKKEAIVFSEIKSSDNSFANIFGEILNTAETKAAALIRRFPSFIEEACANAKLPLDRDSRHPKYKFYDGFFQVEIDDRNRMAKLSDNEGLLDEFPCDVEAIIESVQREYKRIFERPFDGEKFIKKLRHQYSEIIKQQGKKDGENIPIRNITRRLGKNEKGFRTDEFLIDLSRLIEQGPSEIDGLRFDLQQTKDTTQGMLLPGAAGRGYIGFITFRKN